MNTTRSPTLPTTPTNTNTAETTTNNNDHNNKMARNMARNKGDPQAESRRGLRATRLSRAERKLGELFKSAGLTIHGRVGSLVGVFHRSEGTACRHADNRKAKTLQEPTD